MLLENFLQAQDVYFQLARFFVTFFLGIVFTRAVLMPAASKAMGRRGSDKKAQHSVTNVTGLVGLFLTVTLSLQVANFGSLVTLLGTIAAAATVAIGFGMRDQVSNVVAGVFIHTDNPYVQGDYIEVNGFEGVVQDIRLRATVLNGKSSKKQIVPNAMLTTNVVKNYTKGRKTRTSIKIGVKPEKVEKASEILLEVSEDHEEVLGKPAPEVIYPGMDDGKMIMDLNYWIRDSADTIQVKTDVLRMFNKKAVENGVFAEKEEG